VISALSEKSVWNRPSTGAKEMSKNAFAALLTFWTAAGILVSAICAALSADLVLTWPIVIPLMILPFVGAIVSGVSDKPIFSLLGYGLMAVPFGILLGPVVAMYTAASVVKVFSITTLLVVTLGVVGALYPKSLESWGIFLFAGLLVLIFGQFGLLLLSAFGLPVGGAMTAFDWIGVFLFSGYVVFDLNRAMRVERTLDNSIDCAVAVYLDFINLLLRLLRLMGQLRGTSTR
jgi:FtsH-binding integral membrane protein